MPLLVLLKPMRFNLQNETDSLHRRLLLRRSLGLSRAPNVLVPRNGGIQYSQCLNHFAE